MATKTQIRAEDYLRMTFEHAAEFVHGEIVEHGTADEIHCAIHGRKSLGGPALPQ